MTPRRQRFVLEYLKDLNATQAAIRAGYSIKSANTEGPRLLEEPRVRTAIDSALARQAVRLELKQDDLVRELLRIATADAANAVDSKGRLLPLHKMPEDVRRAIASIEVEQFYEGKGEDRVAIGNLAKVKFWPKTSALELLGRHLKMFSDQVELNAGKELMALLQSTPAERVKDLAREVADMSPDELTEVARGK